MKLTTLLVALALAGGAGLSTSASAEAGANVIYGVADSAFAERWATAGQQVAALGKIQVEVFVAWRCDDPGEPVWQVPEWQQSLLTVIGDPWSCSSRLTNRYERTRYCSFVRRLVDQHPGIMEVQIWNEPDLAFWQASQADYVKTLARCYDLLHARVKVLGFGLSPNALNLYDTQLERPTAYSFALNVAVFYEDSHRRRPIMDGFAYHPYWGWRNETTRGLAKLLNTTWRGLPQPTPKRGLRFWWTETGKETGPGGWPDYLGMYGTPEQQAGRVTAVANCARRNPLVAADFNFLLGDADDTDPMHGWMSWTSGLLTFEGERKPAFYAFAAAIAKARP